MSTQEFPTAAIVSLTTGILLCDFSEMHKAAEFMMGHPIWTHHFADKELRRKMRDAVIAQHSDIPVALDGVTKENYKEHVAALEAKFGSTLLMRSGDGHMAMSPLDGIPDHLKDNTILVKV
jgi:hypothetical protein